MKDELSLKHRLVEFLYSIGLPPMRIFRGLIAILVIGAVLGGLYLFNFDSLRTAKRSDAVEGGEELEKPRQTYAFELSLDQQIDELTYFDPTKSGYVVAYGELQKQNEQIEEMRQRVDVTPDQTNRLDRIQLRNLQTLFLQTMKIGVSADNERKAFVDFAENLASGSDESNRELARYSLVRSAVNAFGFAPTKENSESAIRALNQYQQAYINDKGRVDLLVASLLKCKQEHPTNVYADRCVEAAGQMLSGSDDPEILKLASQVGEFSLFAQLDLSTLAKRIRYQDREALMDLDKALRVLEAHPEIDLQKWKLLMRCYEASLSVGRIDDFATGQSIFGELVAKLPESDNRKKQLLELLQRQNSRAQRYGQTIELSGMSIDGRRIEQSNSEFTALILLDRTLASINAMKDLMKLQAESGNTFRPVVAFKDEFTDGDLEKADKIPSWIYVADEETAAKYLRSFPTDFFPYVLLIDEEGVIVAGNLSLVQVANRIASIKKARNASAEPTLTE